MDNGTKYTVVDLILSVEFKLQGIGGTIQNHWSLLA
jgi:hypothetical protein